jgi:hypothetical protein
VSGVSAAGSGERVVGDMGQLLFLGVCSCVRQKHDASVLVCPAVRRPSGYNWHRHEHVGEHTCVPGSLAPTGHAVFSASSVSPERAPAHSRLPITARLLPGKSGQRLVPSANNIESGVTAMNPVPMQRK